MVEIIILYVCVSQSTSGYGLWKYFTLSDAGFQIKFGMTKVFLGAYPSPADDPVIQKISDSRRTK